MANIYQEIWDADQTGSGIKPLLAGAAGDSATGYVTVVHSNEGIQDPGSLKVLEKVHIPESKKHSYQLVQQLFDNYALDEQDPEHETQEERQEVHDFLDAIIDSAPMQVARRYVEESSGATFSRDRWYATLLEQWFRRFSQGGDPALSGFEHVFVGEQEGSKVQGYHFWYKYYLDDGLASTVERTHLPGFRDDRIIYLRGLYENGQENFPESVTISYKWAAPDYDRQRLRPLTKPVGGFFVGCSAEGLMAMGALRAHLGANAPKEAVINGARYDLKLFRSQDNKNIRTFYPMFRGPAADSPIITPASPAPVDRDVSLAVVSGRVRILAALVNPAGADHGKETVTLINVGATPILLDGWLLVDKLRNRFQIDGVTLGAGMATTVQLPQGSIQLSNKGGEIKLVDRAGQTVHTVSYSKVQAKREGETIVF